MKVSLTSPVEGFQKELIDILNLFFGSVQMVSEPFEYPDLTVSISDAKNGNNRESVLTLEGKYQLTLRGQSLVGETALESKRLHKRLHKTLLFDALTQATGQDLPWGSLTGIRPTRLVYEAMSSGVGMDDAMREVTNTFRLSAEKADLLHEIVLVQQSLPALKENEVACYIGVPFCRTRCRYCSFLSSEVGDGRLLPGYTKALVREIEGTIALINKRNLKARSLYIGGGTPTTLREDELRQVMLAAKPLIDGALEVTVEAGRPDTITRDKLQVIRDLGATRISINPQTMHNKTLKAVGRDHTAEQVLEAFSLARKLGFDNINMDLIAGLPGEDVIMFKDTLTQVLALNPEALTVHTLAIKRASDMHRYADPVAEGDAVETMVSLAHEAAKVKGMSPYYLYRQKHMAGNLENVGYAKPNHACLYNIDMMEDQTTVLAMGAGSVSKLVDLKNRRILRSPNVKNVEQYISRVDEMLEKKNALFEGVGKGVKPPQEEMEEAD